MKAYKIDYLIDFFDGEPLECCDIIIAPNEGEAIKRICKLFITNDTTVIIKKVSIN